MKDLLLKMKEYIEATEETIGGEWGSCRDKDALIADKQMPELYNDVLEQIANSCFDNTEVY